VITNLKDNLQGAKNTIISLETRNRQLENEISTLKEDNQKVISNKMKKHDANVNKVSINMISNLFKK